MTIKRAQFRVALIMLVIGLFAVGCSSENANSNAAAEQPKRIAPAVEFTSLNEDSLNTAEVEKPMILSFWASWCQYCKKEIPILDSLYDQYKDEVEFISVNITYNDRLAGAKSFVEDRQLKMPVYLDLDGIASHSFRVLGVPTIVAVDEQGEIVEQLVGSLGDEAEDVYRELLDTLVSTAQ